MLVTDGGTLIRCPVDGIRIAGRATRGVRIVNVSEGERVVIGDPHRRGRCRQTATATAMPIPKSVPKQTVDKDRSCR